MQLDPKGNFVASPLLVEAPTLDNGGLTQSPFTVRFHIAPGAVWDDGSPITSADFRFTWLATVHTVGAYDTRGYSHIVAVDTTDAKIAAILFDQVYVQWPDLFGGEFDYVLKAATFAPKNPDKPNLRREMEGSIPFSAGPFRLESWSQEGAVLVRNENYFGTEPYLDQVTFLPLVNEDPLDALTIGTISAISPDVWSKEPADRISGLPNIEILGGNGTYAEALWFNQRVAPVDNPKVREALMYAIDRQALIDSLVIEWNPTAQILNCGLDASPRLGPWCRTRPFERFTYDPEKARAILEEAGYACAAGPCTREGRPLKIEYWVSEGRVRRQLAQRLLSDPAREAGFVFVPRTISYLGFGGPDPAKFPMAQFSSGGTVDPSVTESLSCDEIPGPPDFYGGNWTGWCNEEATALMHQSDQELDPERRLELMDRIYELEADDFVSLPLFVVPAVSAWRTDEIAGPIGLWNGSPYGLFFNMNEWYVPS
jgi:peptide/nickel transport system substrate-binding protein